MQQTRRRALETGRPLPPRGESAVEARRLRQDLGQAMREGGLVLAFQSRRRLLDDAFLGAEAQVRWPCRGRGVLHGSAFLALITECRLSGDVLAWTLHAACAAAADWPRGRICVSAPARAASDGSLLEQVADALTASSLPPERLDIALNDNDIGGDGEDMLLTLAALRDLGVGVTLEEFGRSRACLIKLRHLPVSTIKLDCSLVRDAAFDHSAAAMARALIDYAHALDIEVAAAVETAAQRAVLRGLGCDAGVGHAGKEESASF